MVNTVIDSNKNRQQSINSNYYIIMKQKKTGGGRTTSRKDVSKVTSQGRGNPEIK